jgi:hypothetical protein
MRGRDVAENRVQLKAQMKKMGLPQKAIDDALATLPPDDIEIWPWQVGAVDAFMVASTQWRMVSMSTQNGSVIPRSTGLDYSAAKVAWEIVGMKLSVEDFSGVRVMERCVISGGEDG